MYIIILYRAQYRLSVMLHRNVLRPNGAAPKRAALNCHVPILTALADTTNDLSMPCYEQRTGAATTCRILWMA